MKIEMVPADMRRAAAAWDSASEQTEKANPVDRIGEISKALPGGASARQVSQLVRTFGERFQGWCAGATQMGEDYRAVAADHQTTDQGAGDEGRKHVAAVSGLATWATGASPTRTMSSGPAIIDPSAPASNSKTNLIARLGELDS